MASTTNTRRTCQECGYCYHGVCARSNQQTRISQYACNLFKTREELQAEMDAARKAAKRKNEERLNFILTGLYIMSTATMQLMEYFDRQFLDMKAEADWRFARKKAANDIAKAIEGIRKIYQHSFMEDQTQVMTGHGTRPFDAKDYDSHELDAKRWNYLFLHYLDGIWQDEKQEEKLTEYLKSLPHMNIFGPLDYYFFNIKR